MVCEAQGREARGTHTREGTKARRRPRRAIRNEGHEKSVRPPPDASRCARQRSLGGAGGETSRVISRWCWWRFSRRWLPNDPAASERRHLTHHSHPPRPRSRPPRRTAAVRTARRRLSILVGLGRAPRVRDLRRRVARRHTAAPAGRPPRRARPRVGSHVAAAAVVVGVGGRVVVVAPPAARRLGR